MGDVSLRYRILDGLPAYGAPAEPFSASGHGMHREGFVVEFFDARGDRWTANFQRGMTALDLVAESPTGTTFLVVAGGQGYVVAPNERRCLRTFGGQIEHALLRPGHLVVSDGFYVEATDGEHLLWRTRRVSWDGIVGLRIEGERALGEAYDPMTDEWIPFSVDLANREVEGGSYPAELAE